MQILNRHQAHILSRFTNLMTLSHALPHCGLRDDNQLYAFIDHLEYLYKPCKSRKKQTIKWLKKLNTVRLL